ncbi:MAG: hypothetical protein GQ557_01205 [Mycoplasmataceae bacterium]|nr:hypothetical protein [Mycoplasmataceae bacterium]
MAYYQQALKDFISTKLSENTKNVLFDVKLYNDIKNDDFGNTTNIDNTYKVETKRYVPTMITSINGEYIPIPNLNGTTNNVEIVFDLMTDDLTGLPEADEFTSVNYDNTLLAIDEFKSSLLAQYYPLGTTSLMFGGEDSNLVSTSATVYSPNFIYLKFKPSNTSVEELLRGVNSDYTIVSKNATHIIFDVDGANTITIPYTVNITNEITITKSASNLWTISNGIDTDDTFTSSTVNNYQNFTMGHTTGFFGKLERLVIDNDTTATTIDDIVNPIIDLNSFDDKDSVTNLGVGTSITTTPNNCILYGEDGNVVFQVYPLNVIGNYQDENGYNYHSFALQLEAFVGDNFLFGNNFEYYIDDEQVYPVDRNHTFALDTQGKQGINTNVLSFIGSESSLDWTQTFFYQPTELMNSLVKKITTGDIAQNTIYTIKVQYPFWNKEYDVIVEGGGMNTDINSITTFTLQFKLADDIIVT